MDDKFDLEFEQFRQEHENTNHLTAKGYKFLFTLYKYGREQYIAECLSKYPDDANCILCLAYLTRPLSSSQALFEKAKRMNNASAIALYFYYYTVYSKHLDEPLCRSAIEAGDALAPFILATYLMKSHQEYTVTDEIYQLYQLAASRGLGEAKYKLANIHIHSKDRYDPEKAIFYLRDIGDDHEQISIRDIQQIRFILDLVNSYELKINELYYRPGGPGYDEALNHFNNLNSKVDPIVNSNS